MRSLKVIFFRDTDKPYTLILSSRLMIALSFSLVAITSLLVFSLIGNVLLLSEDTAAGSDQSAVITDRTGPEEDIVTEEEAEAIGAEGPDIAPEESAEGEAEIDEGASELPVIENNLEPWIADDCVFNVTVIGGPDIEAGEVSIDTRVSKEVDRGQASSGRYIAALVYSDGQLEPVFPAGRIIQVEGGRIINPEDGELFRIAYSRDISYSFAAGDTEQYAALAIFLFDEETRRLLCRTILELTAR